MRPPIIILGAPRSGTKLIRSVLASHHEIAAFPSEIDFVWRHGNYNFISDEMNVSYATQKTTDFVRNWFTGFSKRQGNKIVVEKTCNNCLRVDYVRTILPDARFIHIVRDGRGAIESAHRQWEHTPERTYYLQKLKNIDYVEAVRQMPYYLHYHQKRKRWFNGKKPTKGPRFPGIDEALEDNDYLTVCALQWQACVRSTHQALQHLPENQSLTVAYEDLVTTPEVAVKRMFEWLGLEFEASSRAFVQNTVQPTNASKWQTRLSSEELTTIMPIISDDLELFGYQP